MQFVEIFKFLNKIVLVIEHNHAAKKSIWKTASPQKMYYQLLNSWKFQKVLSLALMYFSEVWLCNELAKRQVPAKPC
jgi:hypothetical protein